MVSNVQMTTVQMVSTGGQYCPDGHCPDGQYRWSVQVVSTGGQYCPDGHCPDGQYRWSVQVVSTGGQYRWSVQVASTVQMTTVQKAAASHYSNIATVRPGQLTSVGPFIGQSPVVDLDRRQGKGRCFSAYVSHSLCSRTFAEMRSTNSHSATLDNN